MPGDFSGVLASLPSGRYGIIFETVDRSLSDPTGIARVTVWRPSDAVCAADELLWTPAGNDIEADANGRAAVTSRQQCAGKPYVRIGIG